MSETRLHQLARSEDVGGLRRAIEQGADPNAHDGDGKTPLFYAAGSKTASATLRCLVEAGADVNATSNRGRTPLFSAAYSGSAETIATLLELGADPDFAPSPDFTALEMAARSNNLATARALLDGGATPTKLALDTALEDGGARMVAMLREALEQHAPGAAPPAESLTDVATRLGETAARWADDSGELAEYLAEGDDGAELIVEQYWEAHFETLAREAIAVASPGRREPEVLAEMKQVYRTAFFADID